MVNVYTMEEFIMVNWKPWYKYMCAISSLLLVYVHLYFSRLSYIYRVFFIINIHPHMSFRFPIKSLALGVVPHIWST